jgi:hypothetical protein
MEVLIFGLIATRNGYRLEAYATLGSAFGSEDHRFVGFNQVLTLGR